MAKVTETKKKIAKKVVVKKTTSKEKKVAGKSAVKKYAVIRINGRQYIVEEGKELLVDKLSLAGSAGKIETITPEVLLVVVGDSVKVGKPIVTGVSVKIKVITEIEKGKKLRVFKYKSKSRYRKTVGFRPKYTRILIEKIS
ncbi:50S ribosomal protein L21 [Candidatus Microgenomates bacterium]|nr:50S ribosomal protein L21 [Candidatus Microgenomates bacterium]